MPQGCFLQRITRAPAEAAACERCGSSPAVPAENDHPVLYRRFTPSARQTHTHTYVHHTPRLGKWVRWMLTSDDSPEENCGYQNSHRIRKVWLLQEITLKWRAGSSSHTHTHTHPPSEVEPSTMCVCGVRWLRPDQSPNPVKVPEESDGHPVLTAR